MRARLAGALLIAGAITVVGAGVALAIDVAMQDFSFSPQTLNVSAGSTITFTNTGEAAHTATADDGSFDTGTVDPGGSAGIRIEQPGAYPYYCRFHGGPGGSGMAGTIVVGNAPTETPLPQTASPLPLIALAGVLMLGAGIWLGRRRPRKS